MKKIFIYITLLVFCASSLEAQKIKKAYRSLEKLDVSKALEQFDKVIADSPEHAGAYFGKALIYSMPNYPKRQPVTAYEYALIAKKNLGKLTPDELNVIKEYLFNTEVRKSSVPVKKKINKHIVTFADNMIKYIREEKSLEIANQVIEKFPKYKYYDNVIHIRNYLEYRKAENTNTTAAFLNFIKKYPKAAQIKLARENYHRLLFKEVVAKNSVEEYNKFIKDYPNAREIGDATMKRNNLAFKLAKEKNTIGDLEKFMADYPESLEVSDAKKLIKNMVYQKAKTVNSLEAYNEFIEKYPSGEMFVDIFNLKTLALGKKFQAANPDLGTAKWIRLYDKNGETELSSGLSVGNKGIIMASQLYTPETYNDAWMCKVDANGVLDWERIFGKLIHDKVNSVTQNTNNDWLMAGYTNHIPDSVKGEAWLFQIDNEGKNGWNRSLAQKEAKSIQTDAENNIYVAGYDMLADSSYKHFVIKLGANGKKQWSRKYTSSQKAMDILLDNESNLIVVCDNWIYKLDNQGYILWEDQLADGYNALKTTMNSGTEIIVVGAKGDQNTFVKKYNSTGRVIAQKELPLKADIHDILTLATGDIVLSGNLDAQSKLTVLSPSLAVKSSKNFNVSGDSRICLGKNAAGELIVLASDQDLILMNLGTNL